MTNRNSTLFHQERSEGYTGRSAFFLDVAMDEEQQIKEARDNQSRLCQKEGLPHFAPGSGNCWRCGRNIYTGPRALDGKTFVTGCPYCNYSFCE